MKASKVVKAMSELRYSSKKNIEKDLLASIKLAKRERAIRKELNKVTNS